MEGLLGCPTSNDNRSHPNAPDTRKTAPRKTAPRMKLLLDKLKDQMREMCSEGEEVTRCMNRLYAALQQYMDLHKNMQGMDGSSDCEDHPGLTSTPTSGRPLDLSPLRVEDWIPNILRHQHTPSEIDDTYFDCSHNTIDALELCRDAVASEVLVFNKSNCCIVDAARPAGDQVVTVNLRSNSPVTTCLRASSSPVTVSSGYDSDNVMPTREEDIDVLLHGADSHPQGHTGPTTGHRSTSNVEDFAAKYRIKGNVPRSRSCLAFSQDKMDLPAPPLDSSKRHSAPCPPNSAVPQTSHCSRGAQPHTVYQSSPRSHVRHCNPNDLTLTHSDVTINSCEYAGSDVSSDYSLIDTYLEPLPTTFPSNLSSPETSRLDESATSVQYWSDVSRSDHGYDDSFSSLSDASSLECSVRWNRGVSVSVDSGRGSWCSQDSFRCKRESLSEGRVTPLSENIYETIPDDIPDVSPTQYARCDSTYDRIDSSKIYKDLPHHKPPQLPARNYRLSGAPSRSSSLNCGPQRTNSIPRGSKEPGAHIDDIVKNSDIVDMSSYHMYTVKDVLDSVDRFAGHLMEGQKERQSHPHTRNGINKSSSLRDMRDVGMSNSLTRSMSSASYKPKKQTIEYFRCGDAPRPTAVKERFNMKAENEHYTAQWHLDVTGKPATYC